MSSVKELEELYQFRILCRQPHIEPSELLKLHRSYLNSIEGLQKDVALVTYEEKCLESFKMFCGELLMVGYEDIVINIEASKQYGRTIVRASPRVIGNPIWGCPLWDITRKYFPISTNRGGDAGSQFQVVEIRFPDSLQGQHFYDSKRNS